MKKSFLVFLFLFLNSFVFAQKLDNELVKVFYEKAEEGKYHFYAKNLGTCEVSIWFDFIELRNIKPDKVVPIKIVVAQGEEKKLLLTHTPDSQSPTKFNYKYKVVLGNFLKSKPLLTYAYRLPYETDQTFKVDQGYFGKLSHENKYAIDFGMPEGTKVCAMREGKVIAIKEDSNEGGPSKRFADLGNYICILHSDGTIASYYHFKQNGVLVNLNQEVQRGEVIGLSGNTGWSTGPHLHIEVFQPYLPESKTLPIKFKVATNKVQDLKQGDNFKSFE